MKIISLTVENFRSITKANQLPISDMTILMGKNNEGKSNLLKALVICLNQISSRGKWYRRSTMYRRRIGEEELFYDFDRDYPLNITKTEKSESTIVVDFELTPKEKQQFQKITNVTLKGNLRIGFGFRNEPSILFQINDTGNMKKTVSAKLKRFRIKIFEWISDKIEVSYIPAIRDSAKTLGIVENMIAEQLSVLASNKKYQQLMLKLEKLQKPILESMSDSLTKGVSAFLPDVKKIRLDSKERIKRINRVATDVLVDDGIPTILEQKGDGIKSLMAISIIQYLTFQRAAKKNIFLAIEEPESHLHPDAIHKLRDVLRDISTKNQVMVSTHSALLTNRSSIAKNLLVDKSKVQAAKSINEIRDILGVRYLII